MSTSTMIDTLLDRSIALGYGNVGLELRRRLAEWPPDPPSMHGQVVLVTGAASGIGLAACRGFATLGARVLAVARSEDRAKDAVAQIQEAVPGVQARPLAADVSSLGEVRSLAERVSAEEGRLHVLVNNAGVMPDERTHTAEGHELTFATHVLGPFALTALLAPVLVASAPARVINVSSGGMYGQGLHADDLEAERTTYGPKKVYARTKREQVVMTEQWAQRLAGKDVVVHAMHPGWVDTKGVREWLPVFRVLTRPIIRGPEQGADTVVWLGGAPQALGCTGKFWHDRRVRPTHYRLGASEESSAARAALWEHCVAALADAGIELPEL